MSSGVVSTSTACERFAQLLRIRLVEEAIADRYSEQEMRCPVHLSIGQEAIAVGVCSALDRDDYLFSTHRAHAHYLAKGGDLRAMLAEIYGRQTGCAQGHGGSMHLIDLDANILGTTPIVGSTLPVAVGAAFGTWLRDESRVTVVFFGDGTTEEGVFAESLNFAALYRLPVLFICENNLYSVYSPLGVRQAESRDIAGIARAHGVAAATGDGNALEEVTALARHAVARARAGEGPSCLVLSTYRWREHCGPNYDDDLGYRPVGELAQWQTADPVVRAYEHLLRDGALRPEDVEMMTARIHHEVNEAFAYARASQLASWNDRAADFDLS